MKSDFIREICLGLPEVQEDIKWDNELCFLIRNKIFCMTGLEGDFRVSFKAKNEAFGELTSREGIFPALYLARYKWIFVKDPYTFSRAEWLYYLHQSYELIKARLPAKPLKKKKPGN